MRIVCVSLRMLWADLLASLRANRKSWGFAFLMVALGVALGVLAACLVAEPTPKNVLGDVLADTYRPFATFGQCFACLAAGLLVCYVSARHSRRPLFWLFLSVVGYALGRRLAFAGMSGVVGVASVFVCEAPFALAPIGFAVGYYAALADVLLTSLRPRYNRTVVRCGVRYLAWGTAICFALTVVAWGLAACFINLV